MLNPNDPTYPVLGETPPLLIPSNIFAQRGRKQKMYRKFCRKYNVHVSFTSYGFCYNIILELGLFNYIICSRDCRTIIHHKNFKTLE